uniref:Calcitonin-like peptide 1 n=1 Tax=Odorrana schmackeri TaxID=110116 RepID=CTLP1_ODOSH|nr:RecName: Full=Calcitonin-like peptide 1; Short=OsCTLP-1 [Odorrana schmackeri]
GCDLSTCATHNLVNELNKFDKSKPSSGGVGPESP